MDPSKVSAAWLAHLKVGCRDLDKGPAADRASSMVAPAAGALGTEKHRKFFLVVMTHFSL